jgi:hypothetical protein
LVIIHHDDFTAEPTDDYGDVKIPRTKTYGRNRRDPAHFRHIPLEHTGNTLEDGSSIPAETFSKFFLMISDRFPQESTGNSQEFIGKKFRPEYCFHFRCFPAEYGDFSAPFLQDPAGYGDRNLRPGEKSD